VLAAQRLLAVMNDEQADDPLTDDQGLPFTQSPDLGLEPRGLFAEEFSLIARNIALRVCGPAIVADPVGCPMPGLYCDQHLMLGSHCASPVL
jgi:hypothetical protein